MFLELKHAPKGATLETLLTFFGIATFDRATNVPNVAPFGACFDSKNISSSRLGLVVLTIDLVLQSKSVYWRVSGANAMLEVKKNVLCLAFVEAQTDYRPRFSIVIGGHQIEDNLSPFDISASRLGFSSSLLGLSTTCSNFNFTSSS